jgi:membrane-bound ClpP family serine protease
VSRLDLKPRLVVPLVAAGSLIVGFAVADWTGLRWLGAIVLLLGGVCCAVVMLPGWGALRTAVLAVIYVAAFVLSHPLGKVIGSWPAVVLVSIVTAAVGYALMTPTSRRVSTTESPARSTR